MKKSQGQFESKVSIFVKTIQDLRKENRLLRQRVKILELSRSQKQKKVTILRQKVKAINRSKHARQVIMQGGEVITGHTYDTKMVSLCVCLSVFASCSLRGIKRVLLCFHLEMGLLSTDLPSKSTISNWVQKYGHYRYTSNVWEDIKDYCIIIDESMVFGQERMMLALWTSAEKTSNCALRVEDVQVLGFAVRRSWKWNEVRDFIVELQRKVGTKPRYLICDGGPSLIKGAIEAGIERVIDIGHEFCKFTSQTYLNDEGYKAWVQAVAKVRFQVYMTDMAYLLPPKQRTVGRFTNMSHVAEWSIKMLKSMPLLNEKEQKTYGWLKEHEAFVTEFGAVIDLNEAIMKIIKKRGISHGTIKECFDICRKSSKIIPQKHINKIIDYLNVTKSQLISDKVRWHASSDVIESLFGKFKNTAPDNPLNGITGRILSLCLITGDNCLPDKQMNDEVKVALESISMSKLNEWKNTYLIENQLVKRKKTLIK